MPNHFAQKDFGEVLKRRKNSVAVSTDSADHGTKNEALKNPVAEKMPGFPGDFELLKLTISSPNKPEGYINLVGAWVDLNLYEDLFSPSLTGTIQISDGVGLLESLPIIGEETVNIQVRTKGIKRERADELDSGPFRGSQNDGIIDIKMRVFKIADFMKINEGLYTYTLHLVSEEYIINLKSKVKKTTLDPASQEPRKISAAIKSIYRQFFQRGRIAKKIFIEPTRNLTNIIIPNQTPFQAFKFLAGRAVSAGKHAGGSSFVFFETIKGFHFVCIETLMAGGGTGYRAEEGIDGLQNELEFNAPEDPVKEVYVVGAKSAEMEGDPLKNIAIEMNSVDEYFFTSNFDVLNNLKNGMYSNRLLTHDLVRMKYETLDFNYMHPENTEQQVTYPDNSAAATEALEFKQLADDARNFHDQFTHLGEGKLCSENQFALGSPESVISFYPSNFGHDVRFRDDIGSSGIHGGPVQGLNIIPNRVEEWMQSRMVQSQQLENIKLNIKAPGLSTRCVGDVIEFKMPTQYIEDRDGITQSAHHTYLSGYYLITKLRHHFTTEKYSIEFEAIKDAFNKSVGAETSAADSPRANHTPT